MDIFELNRKAMMHCHMAALYEGIFRRDDEARYVETLDACYRQSFLMGLATAIDGYRFGRMPFLMSSTHARRWLDDHLSLQELLQLDDVE